MQASNPSNLLAAKLSEELGRFVRNRISDPADAEDVLQDVFVKVLSNAGPEDADKLLPWIYAIARNRVIDFYRKRHREREGLQARRVEPQAPDHQVAGIDLSGALEGLMSLLSPQDQHALRAVDLGGLSQKDYAEQLGLDYTTAKSRVQRARKRLRREFDQCCEIVLDTRGAPVSCTSRSPCC